MMKPRSIQKIVLPLSFMAVLLLPALNDTFGIWEFDRDDENRVFTDSLSIDFSLLDAFPEDCESYVNDNFSFRAPLLSWYHSIKFNLFDVSPHPDKMIVGNNGWYFTSGKHKECYTGKRNFTEDTLELFLNEWKRRKEYLDERNIKMYWVIAPLKHTVYSDELPFNVVAGEKQRVDQLQDYFNSSLPDIIIDPTKTLIDAKKKKKLYYKLDNHWNYRAGELVTKELMSRIQQDFPEHPFRNPPHYTWNDSIEKSGIHYVVLGKKGLGERRSFPLCRKPISIENIKYEFPCPPGFSAPWEFERRFTIESDSNGLKILLIRDSFGHQMMPFVREFFEESVFIFDAWQYKLNEAIIDKVNPDIVVFLTLDSNLEAVLGKY